MMFVSIKFRMLAVLFVLGLLKANQPVLYEVTMVWYVLSCLWDDAYNRTLAANRKE